MHVVYRAANITEAHIVAGMLNAAGIQTHVAGHYLQGGVGELSAMDFCQVQVAEKDLARAHEIVQEYAGQPRQSAAEAAVPRSGWMRPPLVLAAVVALVLILVFTLSG